MRFHDWYGVPMAVVRVLLTITLCACVALAVYLLNAVDASSAIALSSSVFGIWLTICAIYLFILWRMWSRFEMNRMYAGPARCTLYGRYRFGHKKDRRGRLSICDDGILLCGGGDVRFYKWSMFKDGRLGLKDVSLRFETGRRLIFSCDESLSTAQSAAVSSAIGRFIL